MCVQDMKSLTASQLDELLGNAGSISMKRFAAEILSCLKNMLRSKSPASSTPSRPAMPDSQRLLMELELLGQGVMERLQQEGFQSFRTVVLTVRFADFKLHCVPI